MRSRFPLITVLLLSACGSGGDIGNATSTGEKGLDLPDVSKVSSSSVPGGRAPDAKVMRTRLIAGSWKGTAADHVIRVSFGGAGSVTVEDYLKRAGGEALVASASGSYSWRPDGMIAGTLSSPEAGLTPYASFRVSFEATGAATIHGRDASLRISRS